MTLLMLLMVWVLMRFTVVMKLMDDALILGLGSVLVMLTMSRIFF